MKQPYCQQLAHLWLLLATLFLTACGGKEGPPDEATIKQAVNAANELVYDGQAQLAIQRLEELQTKAPNSPLVVESLAFAYAKLPDPGMAALYFDQAYQLAPQNSELALYAAQAYLESGNPKGAAETYRQYLDKNPTDAEAWKALGRAEMELRRSQDALSAFLEAFRQTRETPTHEEAAIVGHLYHAVGNTAQATKWYLQALRPGGAANDRLTAQIGLFDLALGQQEWARAVELMDQIEAEFPGKLDSGPYASARAELLKWRNAQSALAATTIAQNISEIPAAEAPAGEIPASEVVSETVEETVEETVPEPSIPAMEPEPTAEDFLALAENLPSVSASSVTVVEDEVSVTEEAVDESEPEVEVATITETTETVTIDMAASEPPTDASLGNLNDPDDPATAKIRPSTAMVDLTEQVQSGSAVAPEPAADLGALSATDIASGSVEEVTVTAVETVEETTDNASETSITETTVTEMAAADDGAVTETQVTEIAITESTDGETTETIETEVAAITETSDGETVESIETTVAEVAQTSDRATVETVEEGVIAIDLPDRNMPPAERASLAYDAGDYETAIRFYRQALAIDGESAEVSYELSRAFYQNRQFREASIYAAEATRLDSENVRYALNYLRAIQRTVNRDALMRELVRAKEKFPTNPDVTLALGRAYEIIMGNTRNARFLYEEFIALAPEHPRADEIRNKLTRLPR